MSRLVNRIKRLEHKTLLATNGYTLPPRVAGKSRSQAMQDYIEWLQRCLKSTASTAMREKLQLEVFRVELALQGELAGERHRAGMPYADAYRPYQKWLRTNMAREPDESRRKSILYNLAIVENNIATSVRDESQRNSP